MASSSSSFQDAFKSMGKKSTGDKSPSAKVLSNTQSRRRIDGPRSASTLPRRPVRNPSPSSDELIKRVAELEQEKRKLEAAKKKEAKQRQGELMAAKKRISKETRAAQQAVRKSEQETRRLAQQVARVDHASEMERTKQMRQLQKIEETLKKLQTNRNALSEALQKKMAAVGEARGKLAHMEVTAGLLDVGGFASQGNTIKKGVDMEVQSSSGCLPDKEASVGQETSTDTQDCCSDTASNRQDLQTSGSELNVEIDAIPTILNPAGQPIIPNADQQIAGDNVAPESFAHASTAQHTTPDSTEDMPGCAKSLNSYSLMCDSHVAFAGTKDEVISKSEVSPPLWCRIQNAAYRRTTENRSSPLKEVRSYEATVNMGGRISSAASPCRQTVRQASVGMSRRTPSLAEPTCTAGGILRSTSAVSARESMPGLAMPFPAWTYHGVRLQNQLRNSSMANNHQLWHHGLDINLAQSRRSLPTGAPTTPSKNFSEPIAALAPGTF